MSADPTATTPSYSAPSDPPQLDDATRALIRAKARQIVRRAGFVPADADDLEQDIAAHVWTRLERYDRSKADRAVFVRLLVAHATATTLRDRKRQVRRAPPALARALGSGGTPSEPIDPKSHRCDEKAALSLDVGALMASLPPNLRQLAEQLTSRTLAAAARHLGISRATAHARRAELRRAFESAGLDKFLGKRRTPRKQP